MAEAAVYDNKQKQLVHELMEELFTEAEFDDFCATYCYEASTRFTSTMSYTIKITILVETCFAKRQTRKLLGAIKRLKPEAYEQFKRKTETLSTANHGKRGPGMEDLLHHTLASDRYRIDQLLDRGGVGTVFKAHDTRLGFDVAIKVVNLAQVKLPALRERVRQEVSTAMQLDHPGVVKFYDFGQVGPLLYVVMEYIPGQTLQQARLNFFENLDRKAAIPQLVKLARQLCLTVDCMHQQRVLHPGTKPENIMLKNNNTGGTGIPWQPVFINMGLLRPHREAIMTGEQISTRRLTFSVSPELLLGHATDIRSDVYALGVLLYHLAANTPPFRPGDLAEATRLHVNAPPIPPRSIAPDIPVAVEQVILKALAKDPADRYLTAKGMAQALDDCLDHPTLSPAVTGAKIMVIAEEKPLAVTPGRPIATHITLRNRGDLDSHCQVKTDGVPAEWVSISPAFTTLAPGEEREVLLTINPPRVPQSQAQPHNLSIKVTGQHNAHLLSEVQQLLTVAPYKEFRSSLWPQEVTAGQTAQITVENLGNTAETFTIRPKHSKDINFKPQQAQIKLNTGQSDVVDFTVTPHHPWFNESATHTFSFLVSAAQEKPRVHSGTVIGRGPRAPLGLLSIVLLVLCLGAFGAGSYIYTKETPQWVVTATQAQREREEALMLIKQTDMAKTATVQAEATRQTVIQAPQATATWLSQDLDSDFLTNEEEIKHHTTPDNRDSDSDGLPDGAEVNIFKTTPSWPDSDFDGLNDGDEVKQGLIPTNPDSDLDNIPDGQDTEPTITDDAFAPPTATSAPDPITIRFNTKPVFLKLLSDTRPQYAITENQSPAIIEIILSRPTGHQIQVDYATDVSNAQQDNDYRGTRGTLVFAPGDERRSFEIIILDDKVREPNETIMLTLKNPSPGVDIETTSAELVITDDD